MSAPLEVERGPVTTLTLARPERRNALSAELVGLLIEALAAAGADDACRVVLLEGRGDHFCAGADFGDVAAGAEEGARYGAGFEALLQAIESCPQPVVAKVRGAALGAGCQILAAADLVVAAEDAVIGIPSAQIGLLLDLEKIERMVREIGPARARELLLTGRRIDGVEAAAWGLATKAVPAERLDAEARALAESVAAAAPISVRGSKAAITAILRRNALSREGDAELFAHHDAEGLRALTSADLAEGLRARAERRAPRFEGR